MSCNYEIIGKLFLKMPLFGINNVPVFSKFYKVEVILVKKRKHFGKFSDLLI